MKKTFLVIALVLPQLVLAQEIFFASDTTIAVTPISEDSLLADSTYIDSINVLLITDDMLNAIVHQDSALTQLMIDKRIGRVRGEQIIDGFRVQIYASNNQQVAKNTALTLQQQMEPLLDVPVYTQSEPPFWKVRLGNFTTREEANAYKESFLLSFPEMAGSTYVVPDKIIIIQ